jgi:hypothetical protein
MLDEEEWAVIMRAHEHWDEPERSLAVINAERKTRGLTALKPESGDQYPTRHRYQYLLAAYQLFTGIEESNPSVVWHHVRSLYGPACETCGKPLRTPKARLCAACGAAVEPPSR